MSEDVRAYYDGFHDRRMSRYRIVGNLRLRKANRFVRQHVGRSARVLEVGCGIGVTTDILAGTAKRGRVWAFDLSARNVADARQNVSHDNVEFAELDLLSEPDRLHEWVSEPIDVIVLIDVIEHLPVDRHEEVFRTLRSVATRNVDILLSFPSVPYQDHLRNNEPEELQIIDEDVTAGHVERVAAKVGLTMVSWRSVDVWLAGQYVHCVLSGRPPLQPVGPFANPLLRAARRRAGQLLMRWTARRSRSRQATQG